MVSYAQDDGEWFAPKRRGFRHQCCSCGLIHEIDFRTNARGQIEIRFTRHERATAAARRSRKKKVVLIDE